MNATTIVGYAYNADTYCESCGHAIATELIAQGKHRSDSSDEWPQPIFADSEWDAPCHCASGATCLDPLEHNNRNHGALLDTALTSVGRRYVLEAIIDDLVARRPSLALEHWAPAFDVRVPPGLSCVIDLAASLRVGGSSLLGVTLTPDDIADIITFYEDHLGLDLTP